MGVTNRPGAPSIKDKLFGKPSQQDRDHINLIGKTFSSIKSKLGNTVKTSYVSDLARFCKVSAFYMSVFGGRVFFYENTLTHMAKGA